MTAMETLLAHPFEKRFTEFVDDEKITKIKGSIFEKYHITLASSLKDFQKFEFVAEQIFVMLNLFSISNGSLIDLLVLYMFKLEFAEKF